MLVLNNLESSLFWVEPIEWEFVGLDIQTESSEKPNSDPFAISVQITQGQESMLKQKVFL
jgi:hypothetical protein